MRKELEVLKEIGNYHIGEINYCVKDTIEYSIIEDALSRLEKYDALNLSCDELQFIANIIKNPEHQLDKLKAFEIIKEKGIRELSVAEDLCNWDWNEYVKLPCSKLYTKTEFNLLKEHLYKRK